MKEVVAALEEQQAELDGLLDGADLSLPSACAGWTIGDVVLHLAQTNEVAVASATGAMPAVERLPPAGVIDDGAADAVARERGAAPEELLARYRSSAAAMRDALLACDPSARLQWVVGTLAARTLATTRLAETWIHTGDIAFGLGVTLPPPARLWHIARLAHRTLPYAFAQAGKELHGGVRFELTGPDGDAWVFGDDDAPTVIRGTGHDLVRVASRRVAPRDTDLVGDGPDGRDVLALVRTWA